VQDFASGRRIASVSRTKSAVHIAMFAIHPLGNSEAFRRLVATRFEMRVLKNRAFFGSLKPEAIAKLT